MSASIESLRAVADEWVEGTTAYGPGDWEGEPDKAVWRHRGVPCMIVRGPVGALCGYAGVYAGHPWFKKGYSDVDAEVHGGLTFAAGCHEGGSVCHLPKSGEPHETWWLGFDCAHAGDYYPGTLRMLGALSSIFDERGSDGESYKGLGYVRAQVESLADQALTAAEVQP